MTRGGKGSVHRFKLAAGLALCAGLLAPGAAQAKTSLVEVSSTSPAVLHQLEALGLDVTYEGDDRTELMLHGPEDRQILEDSGVAFKVLMEDMAGANDARLAREETAQKRVEAGIAPLSGLPTGRVAYRDLATINAEMQQIATANPTNVWASRSTASRSAATWPPAPASRRSCCPAPTTRASGRRPSSRSSSSTTC